MLDLDLPGLDGPQTLAALRRLNPEIRCCFMRGHAGAYTDEELLGERALALLNKPFGADEIAPILWQLQGRANRESHKQASCPSVLSWRLWGQDYLAPIAPEQRISTPPPAAPASRSLVLVT